jgi:hypothetical protein
VHEHELGGISIPGGQTLLYLGRAVLFSAAMASWDGTVHLVFSCRGMRTKRRIELATQGVVDESDGWMKERISRVSLLTLISCAYLAGA